MWNLLLKRDKTEAQHFLNLDPRYQKVLKIAENIKERHNSPKLLDIGCGDGAFTFQLARTLKCSEVIGVDISKESLEICSFNQRLSKSYCLDIEKEFIPLPDSYFDFVYAGEIIEHLIDTDRLLDEIHRLLTPEGIAIIDTPNLASLLNRIALFLGFQPYLSSVSLKYNVGKLLSPSKASGEHVGRHIRLFTKRSLKQLLELHHFRIIKTCGAGMSEETNLSRLSNKAFSSITSLAPIMIFVVKKFY